MKKSTLKQFIKIVLNESEDWSQFGNPRHQEWNKQPRSQRQDTQDKNKERFVQIIKQNLGYLSDGRRDSMELLKSIDLLNHQILKKTIGKTEYSDDVTQLIEQIPHRLRTFSRILYVWVEQIHGSHEAHKFMEETLSPKLMNLYQLMLEILKQNKQQHYHDLKINLEKVKQTTEELYTIVTKFFDDLEEEAGEW